MADCRRCSIRSSVLFSSLDEAVFDAIHRPIDQITYGPGAQIYAEVVMVCWLVYLHPAKSDSRW